MERFDEGLVLLARRLNVPARSLAYSYEKNASGTEPPSLLPKPNQTERERLARLNHVSVRTYAFFERRFRRELAAVPEQALRAGVADLGRANAKKRGGRVL